MNESNASADVFINHDLAVTFMEQFSDLVVRCLLKLVYSQLTWDIAQDGALPGGAMDLMYLFRLLSKALVRSNLEAVLKNPNEPFWTDEL